MNHRIAILVETSHGSGRDLVEGVGGYIRESGCRWTVDHETQRLEGGPPPWLSRWTGDGVIAQVHSQRLADALVALRVPVIDVLDALPPAATFETAHVDDVAIARLAFDHLAGLGLRSFCYLGPTSRQWAVKRRDGFVSAARAAGCDVAVREFPRSLQTREPASDCARKLGRWLRQLRRPVGLMAANDGYAWLTTAACHAAGL